MNKLVNLRLLDILKLTEELNNRLLALNIDKRYYLYMYDSENTTNRLYTKSDINKMNYTNNFMKVLISNSFDYNDYYKIYTTKINETEITIKIIEY